MKYTPPQLHRLYPECPHCTSGSTPAHLDVACYAGGLVESLPEVDIDGE